MPSLLQGVIDGRELMSLERELISLERELMSLEREFGVKTRQKMFSEKSVRELCARDP